MNIFDLNLRHILVFNDVASSLNMTKSAKRLYITQSAVSQTIKDLENKLSVKLFLRKNKRLILTKEGKDLFNYSKKIMALLEETQLHFNKVSIFESDKLSIGASSTIGNYLLSNIIKDFKGFYTNIDANLFIGNSIEVVSQLQNSYIEIALIENLPILDFRAFRVNKFMEDNLVLICSPQHRFANMTNISIKALNNEPFVLREKKSGIRKIIESEFNKFGLKLNVTYEFNNYEAIKNAVSCNLGLSILSDLSIQNEASTNMIRVINVHKLKLTRWFYILSFQKSNKLVDIFIDYLIKHVKNIKELAYKSF